MGLGTVRSFQLALVGQRCRRVSCEEELRGERSDEEKWPATACEKYYAHWRVKQTSVSILPEKLPLCRLDDLYVVLAAGDPQMHLFDNDI